MSRSSAPGPEARALACQCLSEGANVTLFSAYASEMEPLRKAGSITIRGEGPVGTYQIGMEGQPSIKLSAELDAAATSADLIFVTGPALKQRTYSMVLAGHLRDGQVLVLVNGRTMGAIEMAWYLRVGGDTSKVDNRRTAEPALLGAGRRQHAPSLEARIARRRGAALGRASGA